MTVVVYSKPGCQPCKLTIDALEKLGIDYEKIDVTTDTAAYEVCKSLGYMSAPVVVAGDQHWAGFRPDRIRALAA